MKFLLLSMFVAVALATQEPEMTEDYQLARSLAKTFHIDPMDSLGCINKSEVTIGDMRYMEDTINLSETEVTDMKRMKKASCTVVCCAQKLGVMVGGEVQVAKLIQHFEKHGFPVEEYVPFHTILGTCAEQVTDTSDECMAGYKFMKCVCKTTLATVQHK